jgi:hypothetical protein
MSNLTRRAILRGSSIAAFAAAVPVLASSASTVETDPVLVLMARWQPLFDQTQATDRSGLSVEEEESLVGGLADQMLLLEAEIAATAASSFAGLHAKLMLAIFVSGAPRLPSISDAYAYSRGQHKGTPEHLTVSAWADAERLAGKGGVA